MGLRTHTEVLDYNYRKYLFVPHAVVLRDRTITQLASRGKKLW